MANTYVETLKNTIRRLHKCGSKHVESVHVIERLDGEIAWVGFVEVFTLLGGPAKYCYAWKISNGSRPQYAAIVSTSEVDTPGKAVRVWLHEKVER